MTMIMQARCNKGRGPCRVNIEFNDDVKTLRLLAFTVTGELTEFDCNVKDAGPRIVWCVAHKHMMHFRKLQTHLSTDACGQYCQTATGDKCKCSCGGINHGVNA